MSATERVRARAMRHSEEGPTCELLRSLCLLNVGHFDGGKPGKEEEETEWCEGGRDETARVLNLFRGP